MNKHPKARRRGAHEYEADLVSGGAAWRLARPRKAEKNRREWDAVSGFANQIGFSVSPQPLQSYKATQASVGMTSVA